MRISDWSSDVCSSDLRTAARRLRGALRGCPANPMARPGCCCGPKRRCATIWRKSRRHGRGWRGCWGRKTCRSEEHTSELQSLMRISYAVFCLKKKTSISRVANEETHYTTPTQHTRQSERL